MFSLKTFLLFYTTLLKCFMLSKITICYILHSATISAVRTRNWGKVISIHLIMIRRNFTFFQIIYYLPKKKSTSRKIMLTLFTIICLLTDERIMSILSVLELTYIALLNIWLLLVDICSKVSIYDEYINTWTPIFFGYENFSR